MNIKCIIKNSVSTRGLVLIAPTCISEESLIVLQGLARDEGKELLYFYEHSLAMKLDRLLCSFSQLNSAREKEEDTLIVFPGDSARDVCGQSFFKDSFRFQTVHAKRFWFPNQNPTVTVGEIQTREFLNWRIKAILVMDDVISSGQTLIMLRERNAWKFPDALWYAGSWITRKTKLKGYEMLYSSLLVTHFSDMGLKVPINSLSTMCEGEGQEVRRAYAEKHFKKSPETFLRFFERVIIPEWLPPELRFIDSP